MPDSHLRRWFAVFVILIVTATTACSGSGGTAQPEVDFKPVLLPVKFTIGPGGIDVAGESTFVTPVGVFALNAKYTLPGDRESTHVIIRDRKKGSDDVYRVAHRGGSLRAVVNGRTEIAVADGQVLIDITKGDISVIQFHQVSAAADQPGAIESWWANGVRTWNAGYERSVYKPFMLFRAAYGDSTLNKWYGFGFIWFLLRLLVALVLLPLDLGLTLVFLLAQTTHYFWGPTGANIVWGTLLLVLLWLTFRTYRTIRG